MIINGTKISESLEKLFIITNATDEGLDTLETLFYVLAEGVFDYISYDVGLSIEMGRKLYKTIDAILNDKQLELINSNFYSDYIECLNIMNPNYRLNWGTSIRFCWFYYDDEGYWTKDEYEVMVELVNLIKEVW